MGRLFFELLRVAVGQQDCLSHTPTAYEWRELYAMADKQAVLGICFHGVERLHKQKQTPPQDLLFEWIGITEYIKQKNAFLDKQCEKLQAMLKGVGIRSSILKGQGVARYYGELAHFRQPGDIDVYVDCGLEGALAFAKAQGQTEVDWDYKHLHLKIWDDTEVEMHYRVEVLLNLRKNRRLQRWFKEHEKSLFNQDGILKENTNNTNITNGFVMPSVEFNVFYILLHIYRHFLYEGVGLRQIVDYYMTLRMVNCSRLMVHDYVNAVHEFRMEKFAKGLMWVMHETLGMSRDWMLWEPDEKEGRYILNQVMTGGNFGHHDERLKHTCGKIGAVKAILTHNLHLLTHYPSDVIWAPVWIVWHKLWKMWIQFKGFNVQGV